MSYRFALLGCGRIGARHAAQIASHGHLAAVCDIDPSRASALGEQYGAQIYHSFTQLLQSENIDVVSVCTPNGLHAPHSIEALQAGCHVLCEKPMSISTASAQLMAETGHVRPELPIGTAATLFTITLIEHICKASPLIP
ncbi:Gfo/Idh/MocA family oxidoreductase [Pseudoflavitalea sp. G-6-1-2]|uniref:Gfo/Idh/MocA family protein n=1 Tax=Pseudoflavitalea sp. G-6-1-2 TaxID=2728841 RepID=UPI00146F4813|nr:Gfo/Idh/MocA family oxidoreductase [Pseudoflavitalea sp. G-6-1-2]NML21593.1 Gfo/Idh/MocA family oxidoreductase [Pseudoflavitalea sp. G-6-1-2]